MCLIDRYLQYLPLNLIACFEYLYGKKTSRISLRARIYPAIHVPKLLLFYGGSFRWNCWQIESH